MPHGPRVLRSGAGRRIVPDEKRRAKAKGKEGHTAVPPAREPTERASGKGAKPWGVAPRRREAPTKHSGRKRGSGAKTGG